VKCIKTKNELSQKTMFAKALSKFFHLKAFPKGPIQKARSKRLALTK